MKPGNIILSILTSFAMITGCQPISQLSPKSPLLGREGTFIGSAQFSATTITGKVEFPSNSPQPSLNIREGANILQSSSSPLTAHSSLLTTKALLSDIAPSATVSILYPSDHPTNPNVTIATGLTDGSGNFTINPSATFNPAVNSVYILEASKRIGDSGNDVMAIRTYIKWNGSGWDSMTTPGIYINTKTTALAIIQNNKKSIVSALQTIGKINVSGGTSIPQNIYNNEKMVFAGWGGDNSTDIYVMNPDGTNQTNLTNNTAWDLEPKFSPDGNKIAFVSDRDGNYEIYTMNPDGTNLINISNNNLGDDSSPVFSLDGSKIAFSSYRDGNEEIYVMNVDGTNQTRLTYNNLGDDLNPVFSPDGSKIAFFSSRDGGTTTEIYIMNVNGTNQTKLTDLANIDYDPVFSPDSSKIVFTSVKNGSDEIYVMNVDGTNQTRLTNNSYDNSPAFSPDGSKIVFTSSRDGNYEIYVMNSDGTNQTNLTNDPANDRKPKFSPDGSKITFKSNRNSVSDDIYVMNADGTNQTKLSNLIPNGNVEYSPLLVKSSTVLDVANQVNFLLSKNHDPMEYIKLVNVEFIVVNPPVIRSIIFVKNNATGRNNGTSWTDAYTSLQTALSAATSGKDIWIAGGTYKPTTGTDTTSTFQLKSGVNIYGGFAGTDANLSQRNFNTNVVILSGDLNNSNSANAGDSNHVVTGATGATLDGVTVKFGYTNYGGGMYNGNSLPTLTNVTFSNNFATYGGGMYNENSSPTLINVTFSNNSADFGGGMYSGGSGSSPTLTNVTFSNNSASTTGGGMYNDNSLPTLTNVTFYNNSATSGNGGGIYNYTSSQVLTNVTFYNNSAGFVGGGMSSYSSSSIIKNSIFWGNTASSSNSLSGSSYNITYSDVQGGYTGTGNIDSDPLFVNASDLDGADNILRTSDDGLALQSGSPARNTGTTTGAPASDIAGVSRPRGAGVDMGAYEFVE